MPQSKQASICITIDMKHFTRLQHQSTYLKQLSKIIFNKVQRANHIKVKKTKQALSKIRVETRAKRSTRKIGTLVEQ